MGGALVALLLTLGVATSVGAQTPTPTPQATATAPELFRQGEDAYRIGRYQDAVELWRRAYDMDPRPRIQYNLSQAYERLGRLEDAAASLEIYVRETGSDELYHAEANARLAALRARLSETGVLLTGGPSGGTITIDDQPWGLTPRPDRIPLRPGNHRLEVTYPNGQRFRHSFVAGAGQALEIQITEEELTAPTVVTDTTAVGPVAPTEEPPGHALLFAGAGVAAVGAGMLVYGIERQIKVGACGGGYYCENLAAGQRQRSVGLAVGGVALAGGAALIVVDLLRDRSEPSRVACAPAMLGGLCRVTF